MDDFLINALLAGLGLAFIAGPLGCVVVWRGMAYFGDTLAHSALLGVALAVTYNLLSVPAVAMTGIGIACVLYWLEKKRELTTDTLLGILSHTTLALGLVVVSLKQNQGAGIDLMGYLFGDILAVSNLELMWMTLGIIVITLVFAMIWKPLLSLSVDTDLAQIDGVNVARTRFVFMLLLAITIAIAIKVVGILLITALLIIPSATARLYSKGPLQMVLLSIGFAILAVIFGLGGSFYIDLPTGPSIVLAAGLGFFVSRVLRYQ